MPGSIASERSHGSAYFSEMASNDISRNSSRAPSRTGSVVLPAIGGLHKERLMHREDVSSARRSQLRLCKLKDKVYQSSFALRKGLPETLLSPDELAWHISSFFKLGEEESAMLKDIVRSVLRRNSRQVMDVKTFVSLLKDSDKEECPGLELQETKRFAAQGVMDSTIQRVITNPKARIAMSHYRPENELGRVTVNPPYGVMGDSERMNALISTHLDLKYDTLRSALSEYDTSGKGRITHAQFSDAMRATAHYLFESELLSLLHVVDPKRRGYVVIDEFLNGVGMEFLKKKTDRGSLSGDPLVWSVAPVPPRVAAPKQRLRAPSTRASRLRKTDAHNRIQAEAARIQMATTGQPPRPPPKRRAGGPHWQTVDLPEEDGHAVESGACEVGSAV